MRYFKILIVIFYFVIGSEAASGQSKKFNTALAKQIDSLRDADQSAVKMENSDTAAAAFQRIIRANFLIIKKIAEKYGFPGYDLVGNTSSNNYWLLVQHSDFDVNFQKDVLKLMKVQVDKKNASGLSYAYLTDRININEGKEQIYGTQVNMSEAGTTIKPCIDTLNLDKRRLSVGLTPIKDYLKQCDDAFYEMNKGRVSKPVNTTDSTKKNRK